MPLSIELRKRIESFLADHDLRALYKEYKWGRDTWENGFIDMHQLEVDFTMAVKYGYLTKSHIMAVARWGRLRNPKRIQCPELINITLYTGDDLSEFFKITPSAPIRYLRETIKGFGPTYFSKILMFSRPQLYGAIDTRLVRTFGNGDTANEGTKWLSLKVRNDGNRWYIPEHQTSWPSEYDTWIEILNHIAHLCNTNGCSCPHPNGYINSALREKGIWTAADIETALFSYASKRAKEQI